MFALDSASAFFGFATHGGDQALYRQAPKPGMTEALLDSRLTVRA